MTATPIDSTTFTELQETAGTDFVAELVATFLEEAPHMLTELRRARAEQAADRFRRAAHSLKSNSLTFGALELGTLARSLELGGLGVDGAAIDAVDAEYARAAAALRELCHG